MTGVPMRSTSRSVEPTTEAWTTSSQLPDCFNTECHTWKGGREGGREGDSYTALGCDFKS